MKFSFISFVLGLLIVALIYAGIFIFYKRDTKTKTETKKITGITCEEAVKKVKLESEVADYLGRVPNAKIGCDSQEQDGTWLIHIYEIVEEESGPGHTATFGWYNVSPNGSVKSAL